MNLIPLVKPARLSAALILLAALLAACGTGATASPTQEPTEEPVEATAAPPEPTATDAPTATPEPTGITLENIHDVSEQRAITVAPSLLTAVAFSPTSHEVATLSFDKIVRLWDADSGELIETLGDHGDWGMALAFSPDGERLISAARGSDMIIWNVESRDDFRSLITNPTRVYDIAWSPDGQFFATGGERSSRLTVFDRDGTLEQDIRLPDGWIWSISYSEDYLAVSHDASQTVFIYDAATFAVVEELNFASPAGELDFSPDGAHLVGCFRDGTIIVWDTADWSEVSRWAAHPRVGDNQGCISGAFSRDGSLYFSGGDDGNVNVWAIPDGALQETFEYAVLPWSISLSGDGELLAVGLDNGIMRILGLP